MRLHSTPYGIAIELHSAISCIETAIDESRTLALPDTAMRNTIDELKAELHRVRHTIIVRPHSKRRDSTYVWHCGCGGNTHDIRTRDLATQSAIKHVADVHSDEKWYHTQYTIKHSDNEF